MNMKCYGNSPVVKRVFIRIRDKTPAVKSKALQPKPPCQPAKFLRKTKNTSRCHTPDQDHVKPSPPVTIAKPTFRRSLSPFLQSVIKEPTSTPYFKPKDSESFLSIRIIDKEDSLCLPYELKEPKRPKRVRTMRTSVRFLGRHIDLTKGIFSTKQITTESRSGPKKENETIRLSVNSIIQGTDESTTVASRTPSPVLHPRNNRCNALSRNFKINKQHLLGEVEKLNRSKSAEKDQYEIEAPWESILRDLEDVIQIKELPPHQNCYDMPRSPIKLTRG